MDRKLYSSNFMGHRSFLIIVISLFCLASCSSIAKKPAQIFKDPKALTLLSNTKNKNNSFKTFKGIGKITFINKKKFQTARIAWICSGNKELRIEILGPGGRPVISAACNGKQIYFFSHIKQHLYKKKISDKLINKFTKIPLKFTDIIPLLTGRIPIRKHSFPLLHKKKEFEEDILILKTRSGKLVEKIFLDKKSENVHKIEIFDSKGRLAYKVDFEKLENNKNTTLAKQIKITGDDAAVNLIINRFWTDIDLSPSLFKLESPKT